MINQNDILAALQNGQDPQDIAQAFTDALNGAIKAHAEDQKKTKLTEQKLEDAGNLLNAANDFLHNYYPDIVEHIDLSDVLSAQDFVDICDEAYKVTTTLTTATTKASKASADPILSFLAENGLLS